MHISLINSHGIQVKEETSWGSYRSEWVIVSIIQGHGPESKLLMCGMSGKWRNRPADRIPDILLSSLGHHRTALALSDFFRCQGSLGFNCYSNYYDRDGHLTAVEFLPEILNESYIERYDVALAVSITVGPAEVQELKKNGFWLTTPGLHNRNCNRGLLCTYL